MNIFNIKEKIEKITDAERENQKLEHDLILAKDEIVVLTNDLEDSENKIKTLKNEKSELLKKLNAEEIKNLTSDKEIQRMKNKVELLEVQLEDTKKILEEYKALPDLKNMIDNLSTLTTPNLDKLVEVAEKMKATDINELQSSLMLELNCIERKLDGLQMVASWHRC